MEIQNTKPLCEQARLHYHDLLFGHDSCDVPEQIFNHVQRCWYCRQQIDVLRRILSPSAENKQSTLGEVTALTDILTLHLSYTGKPVTCETVKPFLPGLVIPTLEVRVPTPITVHLDKCPQCSGDFEKIRQLNLTRRQLYRLSEFLSEEPYSCSFATGGKKQAAAQAAAMDWTDLSADDLKHLCKCSLCRDLVYQSRQSILEDLLSVEQFEKIPCEAILTGGFFDYVFPYGLDPADDQYAKFREIFASHITKCPDCLSRMQQLHKSLYQIESRPNSEVVTMFYKDTSAKPAEVLEKSGDVYAGFPVRVEAVTGEQPVITPEPKAPAPVVSLADVVQKRAKRSKLAFGLKAGIAAAIIMAVGLVALFYKPATAKLTIEEKMSNALQKVSGVHTMQFVPGRQEPIQQQWISKKFGIYLVKDEKETVLYDISKKIAKRKSADGSLVESSVLSGEDLKATKKIIAGNSGQVLRRLLRKDKSNSEWNRVQNDKLTDIPVGIEAYEQTYTAKGSNASDVFYKKRLFVDSDTFLLRRMDSYQKTPDENDYTLSSFYIYDYPGDEQIQSVIDGL